MERIMRPGTLLALVLVGVLLLSSFFPDRRQQRLSGSLPSYEWAAANVRSFIDPLNAHIRGVASDSIWAGTRIVLPPTLTSRTLRKGSNLYELWEEWRLEVNGALLFKEEYGAHITGGAGVIIITYRPDTSKTGRYLVSASHANPLPGVNERKILARFGDRNLERAAIDSIFSAALLEHRRTHSDLWLWVLVGIACLVIAILGYLLNRKSVIVNDIIDIVAPALRGKHQSSELLVENVVCALQKTARLCGLDSSANERPKVVAQATGNGRK